MAAKYVPWQAAFTVVQWDQRGAGRTFGKNGPATPEINLARIASDGSGGRPRPQWTTSIA